MRILLYADNHLSTYSSIIRSRGNKYSTRLENQIASLNWVQQLGEEKKVDKIICLGDFFDAPDLTSEQLSCLKEINWSKTIANEFIVGNHELGSQNLEFNSTNALSKIGKVIDKPYVDIGYGYIILYLPYILESNRKEIKEYFKQELTGMWSTCEVKNTIILSHNDIAGIRYGQFESKQGFSIKDIEDNCNLCINGHIHHQTQVSEKIINLGNLTGQNFSEDGFKYSHCAAILDTDTLALDFIVNPYAFNFYKIEVDTIGQLKNQLARCENGVATIKIPECLLAQTRDLCDKNLQEYRILVQKNNVENLTNTEAAVKLDHIQTFLSYIRENLGVTDIITEELNLLEN